MTFNGGGWTLITVRQATSSGWGAADNVSETPLADNFYLNTANDISLLSSEMYISRGDNDTNYASDDKPLTFCKGVS
jgi:hypothetical protein